ncbi:MAG: hypothetical protein ACOVQM_14060, partial [Pirellula sp.]
MAYDLALNPNNRSLAIPPSAISPMKINSLLYRLFVLGVLGMGSYLQPPCHAQQSEDSSFLEFGIFEKTAPRPPIVPPV